MDLTKSNIMKMLKTQMDYQQQRQTVLSKNIANIDTPGYKARELQKPNFDDMVKASDNRMRMRTSDPRHFEGVAPGATKHREEKVDTFETIPSENNVVLEEEMAKIAENNMNYQLTTSTYKKMISMFKIAIKGNAQ